MPRNYIRKTNKAAYSAEQLKEAIRLVKNGTLTAYAASIRYGIPRPTIVNRLYERRGCKSNTLGRATILSREVEDSLVRNLHVLEKYGFGLTRKEILEAVGTYIKVNRIESPFKDGVPGEDWFLGFKKRHCLSVKKPQPVDFARRNACRPDIIYTYFNLLEETLNKLNLRDKPCHIWNLDETSFSKDPSKLKVVGIKGFASTRTIASPGKDNTTVLLGCNAQGGKTPPLIIYKGKHVWDEWTSQEAYPGTVYAATANGWMEGPVFETFFEKVFLPTVGKTRPILLIYDGHSTHVGLNIIEKARTADITILKIPPHTSHVLQPLDLAVNKSFKDKWDAALVKWQRQNIGKVLPKKDFAKMIGQIWTALDPNICSAGFRKAGIYPFNKNVIPEEKFDQSLLKEWKSRTTTVQKTGEIIDGSLRSANSGSQFCAFRNTNIFTFHQPPKLQKLVLDFVNKVVLRTSPGVPVYKEFSFSINNIKLVSKDHNISPKNTAAFSSSSDNNNSRSSNQQIQILDNRPVKCTFSFEDLLLESIKCGSSIKTKRKKIATGAELITHDEVYNRCKNIEAEKEQKAKQKEQKLKEKEQKLKEKEQKAKKKENMRQEKLQNPKEKAKKIVNTSVKGKEKNTKHQIYKTKEIKKTKKKNVRSRSSSTSLSNYSIQLDDSSDYNLDEEFHFDIESDIIISKENIPVNENDLDEIIEYLEPNTVKLTQTNTNTEYAKNIDPVILHQEDKFKKIELYINTTGYISDESEKCNDKKEMHYVKRKRTDSIQTVTEKTDKEKDKSNRNGNKIFNNCLKEIQKTEKKQKRTLTTPAEETKMIKEPTNSFIKEKSIEKSTEEIKLQETNKLCRELSVEDTILTRYYSQRKWKYYIGVITDIDHKKGTYKISYFKTNNTKQGLTFIWPKRNDIDVVPEDVIVKPIELLQINEKPEFVLMEDEDIIYFS